MSAHATQMRSVRRVATALAFAVTVLGCSREGNKPGDNSGEPSIEDARANLRACFGDDIDACAGYPGTRCLCAADASDEACDFRTAEETNYEIADEQAGNECIAACVGNASCEQLKSDRGCHTRCARESCGPYRPIVSWQACATSSEVTACLEREGCADPLPSDWAGEGEPPGELELCIEECQVYLGRPGCQGTGECDQGSACIQPDPDVFLGECRVIEGGPVTRAEVDPAPFAEGCTTSDDCVLAPSWYDCECGWKGECSQASVLAGRAEDFAAELDAAKATCTEGLICPPVDGGCFSDERSACVDSMCVTVDGGEGDCVSDEECADSDTAFLDPEAVRCAAIQVDERLLFLTCAECLPETDITGLFSSPALPSCPSGYFCEDRFNSCQPLPACDDTGDCVRGNVSIPNHANLVCRDELCQPCRTDSDCEGNLVCVADAPPLPGPDEPGTWGARNGCWNPDSDAECLDATCPNPCQERSGIWECQ